MALILASILSMSQPLFFWAVFCALNSLSLALQMAWIRALRRECYQKIRASCWLYLGSDLGLGLLEDSLLGLLGDSLLGLVLGRSL